MEPIILNANLTKIQIQPGKPISLLLESNDDRIGSITTDQLRLLQDTEIEVCFVIPLLDEGVQPPLPHSDPRQPVFADPTENSYHCYQCGTPLARITAERTVEGKYFCSEKCMADHAIEIIDKQKKDTNAVDLPECYWCGQALPKQHIRVDGHIFCAVMCGDEYLNQKAKWEDNDNEVENTDDPLEPGDQEQEASQEVEVTETETDMVINSNNTRLEELGNEPEESDASPDEVHDEPEPDQQATTSIQDESPQDDSILYDANRCLIASNALVGRRIKRDDGMAVYWVVRVDRGRKIYIVEKPGQIGIEITSKQLQSYKLWNLSDYLEIFDCIAPKDAPSEYQCVASVEAEYVQVEGARIPRADVDLNYIMVEPEVK